MDFANKGVKCNVSECIYHQNGCECNRSMIEVSKGDSNNDRPPHYCKSFICKDDVQG
ncbi:MAG: DUF1540 domain-containing protein [Clostridiales bacterium]|nr:DUF1540 domain-containing protein [Clostridiales bacterium]